MPARRWRPADMPSLTGTTAVVTGANSGIGWHTAAGLARHGADVTLAVRNLEKGEAAAVRMRSDAVGVVRVARLDLASLASVQEFAEGWEGPLHLLVNNAGLMRPPRYEQTQDGFELQFGTNHLGHYALTGRLLPALLAAPGPAARVVTVSSIRHHGGQEDVVDGNPPERYLPFAAYDNSKLANVLFAAELQRRAARAGVSLTSTGAHPGIASTNLITSKQGLGALSGVRQLSPLLLKLAFQSPRSGAEPVLYAATAAAPGSYTGPQSWGESRGRAGPARLSPLARDESLAARLWAVSEDWTGVRYEWETPAT